jgi:hypothetical protein
VVRQVFKHASRLTAIIIALAISMAVLPLPKQGVNGMYQMNELSHLVIVDDSTFRFNYSPWESLYCGEVNRTTNISFRLMNNHGAPFYGVRVNFSVYWFDGILTGYQSGEQKVVYVESLRVMHTDTRTVDIGSGVGTRSEVIEFEWVPRFAGSYIWNISVHVRSDHFPVSDVIYPAGIVYRTAQNSSYYNGLWVGTYYTDCSELSGWRSESQGGLKDIKWHVSSHPLAQGDSTLHSSGEAFWVGNETTLLAPTTGVYSLISPRFDLTRFDDSAFSWELKRGAPQIYFLYKYRGKISQNGPAGDGGLFHFVSADDGETWEKLLDPAERHVNISGETVSPIWGHTSHNSNLGGSAKYGFDLSNYHGKEIRIKIEYHPSGIDETGFLIDDIALEGKERVDIATFSISGRSTEVPIVEPGNEVRFWAELSRTGKEPGLEVRAEAVELPDYISDRGDLRIDPPVFSLDDGPVLVNMSLKVPNGAPSGPGRATIRFIGAYTDRDLTFDFTVKDVHDLSVSLEGDIGGAMVPFVYKTVYLSMENRGNIKESVHVIFVSDDGMEWDQGGVKAYSLSLGQSIKARFGIRTVEEGYGPRIGHLIWSAKAIGMSGSEIMKAISEGQIPSDWNVHTLEYDVDRIRDISLFSPVLHAVVADPPDEGQDNVYFKIYVLNRGNAEESIILNSSMEEPDVNITLDHPSNLTIGPGIIDTVVQLNATISYPINPGTYGFHIEAIVMGEPPSSDDSLDFSIRIGPEGSVNGIFIDEASISIAPSEPIMGDESVVSFDAYIFGVPDNAVFNAVMQESGEVVLRQDFLTSGTGHTLCQLKWVPQESGVRDLVLSIDGPIPTRDAPPGLVSSLNLSVRVRFIDISIDWVVEPENETDPGQHYFKIRVSNEGDVRAGLFIVTLNVTSGNETRSYIKNVSDLDPGISTILTFGPIALEAGTTCTLFVETPVNGQWKDNDSSDNRLFSPQIQVGEEPPGVPVWRNGLFLGIAAFCLVLVALGLFMALYRRR